MYQNAAPLYSGQKHSRMTNGAGGKFFRAPSSRSVSMRDMGADKENKIMQKEKRNKITTLTSPLAGSCGRQKGEGGKKENLLLSPLIGFECVRTQNHFPRQGGSQTASGFTLIELLVVVLIIGFL